MACIIENKYNIFMVFKCSMYLWCKVLLSTNLHRCVHACIRLYIILYTVCIYLFYYYTYAHHMHMYAHAHAYIFMLYTHKHNILCTLILKAYFANHTIILNNALVQALTIASTTTTMSMYILCSHIHICTQSGIYQVSVCVTFKGMSVVTKIVFNVYCVTR